VAAELDLDPIGSDANDVAVVDVCLGDGLAVEQNAVLAVQVGHGKSSGRLEDERVVPAQVVAVQAEVVEIAAADEQSVAQRDLAHDIAIARDQQLARRFTVKDCCWAATATTESVERLAHESDVDAFLVALAQQQQGDLAEVVDRRKRAPAAQRDQSGSARCDQTAESESAESPLQIPADLPVAHPGKYAECRCRVRAQVIRCGRAAGIDMLEAEYELGSEARHRVGFGESHDLGERCRAELVGIVDHDKNALSLGESLAHEHVDNATHLVSVETFRGEPGRSEQCLECRTIESLRAGNRKRDPGLGRLGELLEQSRAPAGRRTEQCAHRCT
jgi:hypothetical protein